MQKSQTFTIEDGNPTEKKHRYFGSVRMTYAICAFFATLLHHSMRNAVNYSILCMVPDTPEIKIMKGDPQNLKGECESPPDNSSVITKAYADLPWSRDEALIFQSIFYYGFIVTLPLAGYLSDKYGGKVPFVWSIVLEALCFILIPIGARTSFYLGSSIRIAQGLMAGFSTPALYQLFTTWAHPSERTAALAFAYAGFNIGNLIVFPICANLCRVGWDYIFYLIGGISLLSGVTFQWLIYNTIDDHPRITPEEHEYLKAARKQKSQTGKIPWKDIFTSVPVHAFIMTHFAHTFGMSIDTIMLPRYLKEAMKFSLKNIGYILTLIFSSSLISKAFIVISSIKLENRPNFKLDIYRRSLHFVCNIVAVVCCICIVFLSCRTRWVIVFMWFLICFFTDIAFAGAYWPSILYLAPSYSGLLIGITNCVGLSSSFLVPFIISGLAPLGTDAQWDNVIAVLAAVYLIDALIFGIFGKSTLQPWGLQTGESSIENANANTTTTSAGRK